MHRRGDRPQEVPRFGERGMSYPLRSAQRRNEYEHGYNVGLRKNYKIGERGLVVYCNTKPLYCVRQDPRIPITNSIIIEIKRLRRSRGGVAPPVGYNMA